MSQNESKTTIEKKTNQDKDKRNKIIIIGASLLALIAIVVTLLVTLIPRSYTITWQNYDGDVLEVDTRVKSGVIPTYDGATPIRDTDEEFTYTFSGWNPLVAVANKDQIYIAQYSTVTNSYQVTWQNYDGTILEEETVPYGTLPTYDGLTPTRTHVYEEDMYYEFDGWSPEVSTVVDDVIYVASFDELPLVYTFEVVSNKVIITGVVDDTASVLTVPAAIVGKPVTSIDENAFSACDALESIILPNSIEEIGEGAFSGCSSLKSISIPFVGANREASGNEGVFGYIFGKQSYANASLVEQITYGGGADYYLPNSLEEITLTDATSLAYGAFSNCTFLTSMIIPETVTEMAEKVFGGCSALEEVTLPFIGASRDASAYSALFGHVFGMSTYTGSVEASQISSMGGISFHLPAVLREVTITDASTIGYGAFSGCKYLTSIHIAGTATSIGPSAFFNCEDLGDIVIPESVTEMGNYAFCNCSALGNLDSQFTNITSIGDYAFGGCSVLNSIVFSASMTEIGDYAFYGCANLATILIPETVTVVGTSAFIGCTVLTINCQAESKPAGWANDWNVDNLPVVWNYH